MDFRRARSLAESELSGLDDPRLEAELLLRYLTGWSLHEMYANLDTEMPPRLYRRYMQLTARRRLREPLQHITGSVEFMGRNFSSGPGALIPRPETEILVGILLELLESPRRILDVGTGSGVIAVSLALEYSECFVAGTDISMDALSLAARNIEFHGACNVSLVRGHLIESFILEPGFDCIAANLPYIPSSELKALQPEVRLSDPAAALDGGPEGLELVNELASSAPAVMKEGGLLALELDPGQVISVAASLEERPQWKEVSVHDDLTGRPRVLTARKMNAYLQ